METILTALMRIPVLGSYCQAALIYLNQVIAKAMRRVNRNFVRPREWSNVELRKVASFFEGAVVNVSGWRDDDKEGGKYSAYFSKASSYSLSNYYGEKGLTGKEGEILLDLESPLPENLVQKFDVVFNHTVLEHIFNIQQAVKNMCSMSKDVVILVTPFLQQVHFEEGSFGDWWRPTPQCLEKMLDQEGFKVIYQTSNDNPFYIVYVFTVACRDPGKYKNQLLSVASTEKVGSKHFHMSSK